MGLFWKSRSDGTDRTAEVKELFDKGKYRKVVSLLDGADESGLSPEVKYILAQSNRAIWGDSRKKEAYLDAFIRLNEQAAEVEYIPSMVSLAKYYAQTSELDPYNGKNELDPEKAQKARHWYEMALAAGCDDPEVNDSYNDFVKMMETDMDNRPFRYFKDDEAYQRIRDYKERMIKEAEQTIQEADRLMEEGDKEAAGKLYRKVVNLVEEKLQDMIKPFVGRAAAQLAKMAADNTVHEVADYEMLYFTRRAFATKMPEGYAAEGDYLRIRGGRSGASMYKTAAEGGVREAYFWYGLCCYYGIDVDLNYAEAAEYLSKVCAEEPRAAYLCGVMYSKGLGVPMNKDMARGFFDMAAAKGWDDEYNARFEAVMEANNSMVGLMREADKELMQHTRYVNRDGKTLIWSVYGYAYEDNR